MSRIQAAKDSLYVALRDRLQTINPQRIALIAGTTRIAIAVEGSLQSEADRTLPGVFYLSFGQEETVANAAAPGSALVKVHCAVRYAGVGVANPHQEADLSEMDAELLGAMVPSSTGLMDYSQGSGVALGDRVFWTLPVIGSKDGERRAEFVLFVSAS